MADEFEQFRAVVLEKWKNATLDEKVSMWDDAVKAKILAAPDSPGNQLSEIRERQERMPEQFDEAAWLREVEHRRKIDERLDHKEAYMRGETDAPPPPLPEPPVRRTPEPEVVRTPEQEAAITKSLSGLLKPAPEKVRERTLERDKDARW